MSMPVAYEWMSGGCIVVGKLVSRSKIFNADAVRKGVGTIRCLAPIYLRQGDEV
jgi:hypothetical protein